MDLFPHKVVRPIQKDLIIDVKSALENGTHLIAHAPTGLGKTASTLPSALNYALKNGLTVFFLTNRHTQHQIAVDTLKKIHRKHGVKFTIADIIGKRWMCGQPDADKFYSSDFAEYCKSVRAQNTCEFYTSLYPSNISKKALSLISELKISSTEEVKGRSVEKKLCPYYLSTELAKKANVIIADYYYVFDPLVRASFFARSGNNLENCIVIVDEAHNLPDRIRGLLSARLSTNMIKNAIVEAKKFGADVVNLLQAINQALLDVRDPEIPECLVTKREFVSKISGYNEVIKSLEVVAESVRSVQNRSFIGGVSAFLDSWLGNDRGFMRYVNDAVIRGQQMSSLHYVCLDPSVVSKDVFDTCHSAILMSGTLTPTEMFKDVLSIKAVEKVYPSPFPEKNRITFVVPGVTTKYVHRNSEMYVKIAQLTKQIQEAVPGNLAFFFPSYNLMRQISFHMRLLGRTYFLESSDFTKQQKHDLLNQFKNARNGVLLGVANASFAEGVDYKDNLLKAVVVVGLPLARPDLKTKQLIAYYETEFGRGWDYGYIMPAFNKILQAAGRSIRSGTDKGALIFLDDRFLWPNYKKLFPSDWNLEVCKNPGKRIKEFFLGY